MNFLAHIYLSFGDEQLSIGNFIADSVRGRDYKKYPEGIRKGILLHRQIDTYTDSHPLHRKSSKRLHENYGHYSQVIVDIYYDHFLAKNWKEYSENPLEEFVDNFYGLLGNHYEILPSRVQQMMPFMISDNWLLNYAELEGIGSVLQGMNRRTKYRSRMNLAIEDLQLHYPKFEEEFRAFFEELIIFSRHKLKTL